MTVRDQIDRAASTGSGRNPQAPPSWGKALVGAGGVVGGIASMSCCVVPFLLFSLGVGGAWMSNLTSLAAYQPIFLGVTLTLLAAGFVWVYRKPKAACVEGTYCARPASDRFAMSALWTATALVVTALLFPYVVRLTTGT